MSKPSELQTKARERNWDIAKIKGSCGNLRHIAYQHGRSGIACQLELFEEQLIKNVKDRYDKYKASTLPQ